MASPGPSVATRASRARTLLRLLGAAATFIVAGCVQDLSPKAQRAADVFECYVAALTPYVGDACDVAELVRDAIQGRADLPRALEMLGSTPDDMRAIAAALQACRPAPEAPPVNPRTLASREPPY